MFDRISHVLEAAIFIIFCTLLLNYSNPPTTDKTENIRAFTRNIEFDYITWTINAALIKMETASIGVPSTFTPESQKQIVMDYLHSTQLLLDQQNQLEQLYADASITDKETASTSLRAELGATSTRQSQLAPLAEATIQNQVSLVLAEEGLTTGGQTIPNVLFHSTPLPMALIVSPRDRIDQAANISLETNITIDEQAALENHVDKSLNLSSLVVPVGGIGVYPTMVMQTTDIRWLLEVISHEWTHNYLTLRPLGLLYNKSSELRTMNETTANISGKEVGTLVLQHFYPELAASNPPSNLIALPLGHPNPGDLPRPVFDFRAEMHETRVTVDAYLAQGKIEEAESYMESRRLVFMQHGYLLRKLNQAYFAFYGAYADVPGGAAGEDPVGPAVRALREQSASLADFINRMSWMTSFEQLQETVAK